MRLVTIMDVREPDLVHIESPFFACSKVRHLRIGSSGLRQISGIPPAPPGVDPTEQHEKLLRDLQQGNCFLVLQSGLGPFQPPVRWQPDAGAEDTGHWVVDQTLAPRARFNLERAIARIERDRHHATSPTPSKSRLIPINGDPWSGILKRYANWASGGEAFPTHQTAADENSVGSSIRNLYGGNDTIQNQADIAAYNDKPSVLGVTHGQIFDAMEKVVTVAGLLEGGLALSRLRDVGRITESVSSARHNNKVASNVDRVAPGPVNFMGEADNFYKFSSRRADIDPNGYFDVVAHGSPDVIEVMTENGPMIVNHRTAARLIRETPSYNDQPIRLLSCETGACNDGFAQNLANKLNVQIEAPTELVWASQNGQMFVAPRLSLNPRSTEFYKPDLSNPGTFRTFTPGGNK